jgi:Flp pilus assembly pilin Flp
VDGTRIKAVNNKHRNFTHASLRNFIRAADERLHDYLQRLDQGDADEDGPTGSAGTKNLAEKIEALRQKRAHYGSILEELERTGESQVSLTGPDSRAMAAHTKVGVGYNVQIAVDAKHIEYGLIAALIAVASISVMTTVGHNLSTTFNTVATKL